ncbi:MAG: chromosome partitioning protein ParB, partial [Lachnospiraceae bacterium]|nr:chromosome partitioning protein ParB [Lachnospiraceae bacterium]
ESAKQLQRYMKLTELIPELLQMLDDGKISFNPAFEIAFLKEEEQRQLKQAMDYTQCSPSLSQAQRIKKLSQAGELTAEIMNDILGEVKKGETERVYFKNEQLYKYFPRSYTSEQMKREILEILKIWMEKHWDE